MTLGEKLFYLREYRQIAIEVVAENCDIPVSKLEAIERNEVVPTKEEM